MYNVRLVECYRAREEKELLDRLAREELDRQMVSEEKDIIEAQRLQSDRRKKQIIKIEMVKAKIASHNLQVCVQHIHVLNHCVHIVTD